ncbi:MAG: galactokinase [Desulfamplus sp.]|nr:galactokinase [Desulfamplus sp.]
MNFKQILENKEIKSSVPCRIDLGGTLDISTFFLPLGHLKPATFNIALDMRTTVTLSPWKEGYIKISSRGFDSAEFEAERAPFNHPMGLMFAVVNFFNGHGVHVQIESSSPPRSALGGSSAAAVAMIAAFRAALDNSLETQKNAIQKPSSIALLAHYIESSVAGVPCGLQDQLAAAYGGVNCWYWGIGENGVSFTREKLMERELSTPYDMNQNILVAYCGIPHVSSDINQRWVNRFLSGKDRNKWREIITITHYFSSAVKNRDFNLAASLMNKETLIRLEMTPDVLDKTGKELFECAINNGCGTRFTGAGGGGCLWAIGEQSNMKALRSDWKTIVDKEEDADILDTEIDFRGIIV